MTNMLRKYTLVSISLLSIIFFTSVIFFAPKVEAATLKCLNGRTVEIPTNGLTEQDKEDLKTSPNCGNGPTGSDPGGPPLEPIIDTTPGVGSTAPNTLCEKKDKGSKEKEGETSDNRLVNCADCKDVDLTKNCRIAGYLQKFINAISAIVGIVCVVMIAVWGIQYTIARDNPQTTATARLRLVQTVIALVSYLFVYAFLQWVVPGGVF